MLQQCYKNIKITVPQDAGKDAAGILAAFLTLCKTRISAAFYKKQGGVRNDRFD